MAAWLHGNDMIAESVLRDAQEIAVINSALELEHLRRLDPKLTRTVMAAVSRK